MTKAILVGDNRKVGRGLAEPVVARESAMLFALGLGSKKGLGNLGELAAANGVAYVNHTTPFSVEERPDLAGRAVETGGPPLSPGAVLSTYVAYIPVGAQPDASDYAVTSTLTEIYDRLSLDPKRKQYFVATIGEFEEVHWHAFQRPPIYGESGSYPDGRLKPEYLKEDKWSGVWALACGYVQAETVKPGEHKIVYKGRDHSHLLRLRDDSLGDLLDRAEAGAGVSLTQVLDRIEPHSFPGNPVHAYPTTKVRRAVVKVFDLEAVEEI
jgi:hypothetical protein